MILEACHGLLALYTALGLPAVPHTAPLAPTLGLHEAPHTARLKPVLDLPADFNQSNSWPPDNPTHCTHLLGRDGDADHIHASLNGNRDPTRGGLTA